MSSVIDPRFLGLIESLIIAQSKYIETGNRQDQMHMQRLAGEIEKWLSDYRTDIQKLQTWVQQGEYKTH